VLAIAAGLAFPLLAAIPLLVALIWTLLTKLTSYELTTERLIVRSGLINRKREEIELFRLRDFTLNRPFWWLILGLGTITVTTSDATTPTLCIGPIAEPEARLDALRRATVDRQRRVRFRDVELSDTAGDAAGAV
jgi:uncharacterized membrane protein YdbT with pleckstrin-like domain